jgi:uncharacterized membrane protein YkvA (DUF1232 family)
MMNDKKSVFQNMKMKAKKLKSEIAALFLACKRSDVPWYTKLLAIIVVGYALSPIDLIPDFIPILGYLDDIVLLPLGIALVIKLIPNTIMDECRREAKDLFKEGKPKNRVAAAIIILIWMVLIGFVFLKLFC